MTAKIPKLDDKGSKYPDQIFQLLSKTSEPGDTDFLARTAVSLCDQVSRALQFLATRDIPHGNVAASNVIVISVAKTDVKVKLGDPGELLNQSKFLSLGQCICKK